jgi:hypothetical protein
VDDAAPMMLRWSLFSVSAASSVFQKWLLLRRGCDILRLVVGGGSFRDSIVREHLYGPLSQVVRTLCAVKTWAIF